MKKNRFISAILSVSIVSAMINIPMFAEEQSTDGIRNIYSENFDSREIANELFTRETNASFLNDEQYLASVYELTSEYGSDEADKSLHLQETFKGEYGKDSSGNNLMQDSRFNLAADGNNGVHHRINMTDQSTMTGDEKYMHISFSAMQDKVPDTISKNVGAGLDLTINLNTASGVRERTFLCWYSDQRQGYGWNNDIASYQVPEYAGKWVKYDYVFDLTDDNRTVDIYINGYKTSSRTWMWDSPEIKGIKQLDFQVRDMNTGLAEREVNVYLDDINVSYNKTAPVITTYSTFGDAAKFNNDVPEQYVNSETGIVYNYGQTLSDMQQYIGDKEVYLVTEKSGNEQTIRKSVIDFEKYESDSLAARKLDDGREVNPILYVEDGYFTYRYEVRQPIATTIKPIVSDMTENSNTISWSGQSDSCTGIEIFRDGEKIASLDASAVSYEDTDVTSGTLYNYTIRELLSDSNVSEFSNPARNILGPENFNVVQVPKEQAFKLTWEAPKNGAVTGYKIYRNGTLLTEVGADVYEYTDKSSIKTDRVYRYYVEAIFGEDESAGTLEISVSISSGDSTSRVIYSEDFDLSENTDGLYTRDTYWDFLNDSANLESNYELESGAYGKASTDKSLHINTKFNHKYGKDNNGNDLPSADKNSYNVGGNSGIHHRMMSNDSALQENEKYIHVSFSALQDSIPTEIDGEKSAGLDVSFELLTESGNREKEYLHWYSDGYQGFNDAHRVEYEAPISPNKWVKYDYVFDTSSETLDVYLNGHRIVEKNDQKGWYPKIQGIYQLNFQLRDMNTGEEVRDIDVYLDDIKVTYRESAPVISAYAAYGEAAYIDAPKKYVDNEAGVIYNCGQTLADMKKYIGDKEAYLVTETADSTSSKLKFEKYESDSLNLRELDNGVSVSPVLYVEDGSFTYCYEIRQSGRVLYYQNFNNSDITDNLFERKPFWSFLNESENLESQYELRQGAYGRAEDDKSLHINTKFKLPYGQQPNGSTLEAWAADREVWVSSNGGVSHKIQLNSSTMKSNERYLHVSFSALQNPSSPQSINGEQGAGLDLMMELTTTGGNTKKEFLHWYSNGNQGVFATFYPILNAANKWVSYDYVFDKTNQTVDIYVNGYRIVKEKDVSSEFSQITGVALLNFQVRDMDTKESVREVDVYLDEIKVEYCESEPNVSPYSAFGEAAYIDAPEQYVDSEKGIIYNNGQSLSDIKKYIKGNKDVYIMAETADSTASNIKIDKWDSLDAAKLNDGRTSNPILFVSDKNWTYCYEIKQTETTKIKFEISDISQNGITLAWSRQSENCKGIEIFRDGKRIASVDGNLQSYEDTNVISGQEYEYSIREVLQNGNVTRFSDTLVGFITSIGRPENCVAVSIPNQLAVKLTWETPGYGTAAGYEIYRNGTLLAEVGAAVREYTDNSNLKDGVEYRYSLVAVGENSDKSAKTTEIAVVADIISPPQNVKAEAESGNIKLSWDKVEGAAGYEVYRNGNRAAQTQNCFYVFNDCESDALYEFYVKAVNADGQSSRNSETIRYMKNGADFEVLYNVFDDQLENGITYKITNDAVIGAGEDYKAIGTSGIRIGFNSKNYNKQSAGFARTVGMDLSELRENGGEIRFLMYVPSASALLSVSKLTFGVAQNCNTSNAETVKLTADVALNQYVNNTGWNLVRIPLKDLPEKGVYTANARPYEVKFDYANVEELGFFSEIKGLADYTYFMVDEFTILADHSLMADLNLKSLSGITGDTFTQSLNFTGGVEKEAVCGFDIEISYDDSKLFLDKNGVEIASNLKESGITVINENGKLKISRTADKTKIMSLKDGIGKFTVKLLKKGSSQISAAGKVYCYYSDTDAVKEFEVKSSAKISASDSSGNGGSGGGSSESGGNRPSENEIQTTSPIVQPTATSTPTKIMFSDISSVEWAREGILYLSEHNVISGYEDNTFRPDNAITREEFVTIIVRAFGLESENNECNFLDVSSSDWYYNYVASAVNEGIIVGIDSNTFGAGQTITRQDMCVIVNRIIKSQNLIIDEKYSKLDFTDYDEIADYARESVTALQQMGIVSGMGDNVFAPKGVVTRAMAAKVIYQMMQGENSPIVKEEVSVTAASRNTLNEAERLIKLGFLDADGIDSNKAQMSKAAFVKTAVRMYLSNNSASSDGKVDFKDVVPGGFAANEIQFALEAGLIEKTDNFYPENPISYDEAIKIIVKVLGYDIFAESKGYIGAAADADVLKGVNSKFELKDAIKLLDNALDSYLVINTSSGSSIDKNRTLLTQLGILKKRVNITGVDIWNDRVDTDDGSYNTENIDLGVIPEGKADIYIRDNDDVVIYIDVLGETKVVYDFIEDIYRDSNRQTYPFGIKKMSLRNLGETFVVDKEANITMDEKNSFENYINSFARIIIKDNKIVKVDAYSLQTGGLIYRADSNKIKYVSEEMNENVLSGFADVSELEIYIDGVRSTNMLNLKADMVFDYWHNDDKSRFVIVASSRSVKGKLGSCGSDSIRIDGTEYEISEENKPIVQSYVTKKYSDKEDYKQLIGKNIEVFIDDNKYIRFMKSDEALSEMNEFYGIVLGAWETDSGEDYEVSIHKITGGTGEATYKFASKLSSGSLSVADVASVAKDYSGRGFLKFTLNANGEIKKIETPDYWGFTTTTKRIEKGSNIIGMTYQKATVFALLDIDGKFTVKHITQNNLDDTRTLGSVDMTMVSDFDVKNNPVPRFIALTTNSDKLCNYYTSINVIESMATVWDEDAGEEKVKISFAGGLSFSVSKEFVAKNNLTQRCLVRYFDKTLGEDPFFVDAVYDLSGDPQNWKTDAYTQGKNRAFFKMDSIRFRDGNVIQFETAGEPTETFFLNDGCAVYEFNTRTEKFERRAIEDISKGDTVWIYVTEWAPNYGIERIYYVSE